MLQRDVRVVGRPRRRPPPEPARGEHVGLVDAGDAGRGGRGRARRRAGRCARISCSVYGSVSTRSRPSGVAVLPRAGRRSRGRRSARARSAGPRRRAAPARSGEASMSAGSDGDRPQVGEQAEAACAARRGPAPAGRWRPGRPTSGRRPRRGGPRRLRGTAVQVLVTDRGAVRVDGRAADEQLVPREGEPEACARRRRGPPRAAAVDLGSDAVTRDHGDAVGGDAVMDRPSAGPSRAGAGGRVVSPRSFSSAPRYASRRGLDDVGR